MRTGPRWILALELPEDVAGAQAAADAEDRGLGQRLARHARDDALVRQDVGQRGRLRVQAAAHPIARRGGGVGRRLRVMSVRGALDQGPSGGGVSLAGLGHARTHDPLEGLVGGHRSVLRHGRRRTRPHRHVVGRSDGRPVRPEDPDPLYRRIAAPRGGSVWQSGAGARRRQCTTPRNGTGRCRQCLASDVRTKVVLQRCTIDSGAGSATLPWPASTHDDDAGSSK